MLPQEETLLMDTSVNFFLASGDTHTMSHPRYIVSSQVEEFNGIQGEMFLPHLKEQWQEILTMFWLWQLAVSLPHSV